MTQQKPFFLFVAAVALALGSTFGIVPAVAQAPVRHADVDFEASGYVTPAGMVHPSIYEGGVMPVGCLSDCSCDAGCDSTYGGCDSMIGCDGMCACEEPGSGILDGGSCLLRGCRQRRTCRPRNRNHCLFCGGRGCCFCYALCQSFPSLVDSCRPYGEICGQRWYDLSLESVFLSHSNGGLRGPVTSQGSREVDPNAPFVLALGDADSGNGTEYGTRVSVAAIFGAGGNLESTYMGGHEWKSRATTFSDPVNTPTLFSFISDFGRDPPGGFDDTDRSILQSVANNSDFHSVELNYRRRTMGPYCRFQGSWLIGLRYLRFDNRLIYSALGEMDNTVNTNLPRFFSSNDKLKNNVFGPQAGFDLWWNITGGVNLGFGMKGAWMQNDAKRQTIFTANSLDPMATPGAVELTDTERRGTVMGELEAKLVYRFCHSLSFRTAYYAIAVDDIAFGTVDRDAIRDFITVNPISEPRYHIHSLTVQGFSFGAEYTW